MGRPLRTRIDFAKTISWYDFFYNKLLNSGEIRNEFGLEKLLYKEPKNGYVTNLFKKYKFGLSTPKDDWIKTVDSKCIGSSHIINHPIWKNLKYRTTEEYLILLELNNLPDYIIENLIQNRHIKGFNKSDLEKIAKYGSLDSLCALYLLHQWGYTIGSTSLVNDCCSLIINNLELVLEKTTYLQRSHIFLFDEICDQIFIMELKGYNRPLKIKLNWRQYRNSNWDIEIREKSKKIEDELISHPKTSHLIPCIDESLADLYKKILG
ncbi:MULTISPECIES: hypothetical protein [unclassified Acinetobacter]|uniref:hypothetical protein n=1 Tax=unclassified Acinetobacter TaxID=196816 RepID=UPI0015D25A58|nr:MULTISPECIES: hypothetical protein [unclassified Acinetobacter]UUS56600.1 hypothetical protein MST16_10940 [Acinetobacter sp. YH16040_T]